MRQVSQEGTFTVGPVTFDLAPGQGLALLGANGSGKSTILKAVGQVLPPYEGSVLLPDSVITILDVNLAFHPDFTGWENVLMMNACHGRSDPDLAEFEGFLHQFAGISPYLHRPIREYSTGMRLRLGIAWMLRQDCRLLILDELLSVGDLAFQRSVQSAICALMKKGMSLLLATHNLQEAVALCNQAVLLDRGQIMAQGKVEDVVSAYLLQSERHGLLADIPMARPEPVPESGEVRIVAVRITDLENNLREEFVHGETLVVHVDLEVGTTLIDNPLLRLLIHRNDGIFVAGMNNYRLGQSITLSQGEASVVVHIRSLPLLCGRYNLALSLWPDEYLSMIEGRPYAVYQRDLPFLVNSERKDGAGLLSINCGFYLQEPGGLREFDNKSTEIADESGTRPIFGN